MREICQVGETGLIIHCYDVTHLGLSKECLDNDFSKFVCTYFINIKVHI